MFKANIPTTIKNIATIWSYLDWSTKKYWYKDKMPTPIENKPKAKRMISKTTNESAPKNGGKYLNVPINPNIAKTMETMLKAKLTAIPI